MIRVLVLCLLSCNVITGLQITFVPNPDTINQLSTDPQRLSCAVHQNPNDNIHITSIVISRPNNGSTQNETVALVTAYAPPTATVDQDLMIVTGDVQPGGQVEEFLNIEWPEPQDAVIGEYYCEIFALDQLGHPMSFVYPATINSRALDLADAIKYIMLLQADQMILKDVITGIQNNCSCANPAASESDEVPVDQDQLLQRLAAAESDIVTLTSMIESPSKTQQVHLESGHFRCGPNLPPVTGQFAMAFNGPAKMVVSIDGIETQQSGDSKVQVTPSNDGVSYTLACGADTNIFASGTWMAFEDY